MTIQSTRDTALSTTLRMRAWSPQSLVPAAALTAMLAVACVLMPVSARTPPQAAPSALGVPGVGDAQLTPAFWLAQLRNPDQVLLSPAQIARKNQHVAQNEDAMHDLAELPALLPRAQVQRWIQAYDGVLQRALFDEQGQPLPEAQIRRLRDSTALDAVQEQTVPRFGLVVQRAAMRAFPTALRVFNRAGETDIDRFQESAEFPGTPVAIVHASRDGDWLFVVSQRYAAWMEKRFVAEGPKAVVLGYGKQAPYRIVTAAKTQTVYTREAPRVSELQLDMGVRIPVARPQTANADDAHVNGQHRFTAWVLELPVREADGKLSFAPALLPKRDDSQPDYLPLTQANILTQAFKFLGERYGWGHSYNGRDCSGFVAEVYRSMGIILPRNTSDQATSPGLQPRGFDQSSSRAEREAAIAQLEVGDLIYIPGHVMMMIGRVDGEPYVIHDTNGGSVRDANGQLRSLRLNGVVVTPLRPLMYGKDASYVDRMTSIVRIATPAP